MSIVKTYDVFCDAEGCPMWAGDSSSTLNSATARRLARREGWVRRNGQDLCPDHAKVTT